MVTAHIAIWGGLSADLTANIFVIREPSPATLLKNLCKSGSPYPAPLRENLSKFEESGYYIIFVIGLS